MRAFLALSLPDDVKEKIGGLTERLKKGASFTNVKINWVPMENLHLTLRFLGNDVVDSTEVIDAFRAVMEDVAAKARGQAVQVQFQKLGCFPHAKNPKVLWLGLHRSSQRLIEPLVEELQPRLADLGFPWERRPFKAHLTLARFPALKGTHAVQKLVSGHQRFAHFSTQLNELVLYESDLSGGAPLYKKRLVVQLDSAKN
jgi:2'-5' RNA ligase